MQAVSLMELIEVILGAFCATTLMTLFSYVASASFRKLYKEPVLLEILMSSFHVELSGSQKQVRAWVIHYSVGLIFTVLYYAPVFAKRNWYEINLVSGLVFGTIIGVIGIMWWRMMFLFSGKSAILEPTGYYIQLFAAHLIFGQTLVLIQYLFITAGITA